MPPRLPQPDHKDSHPLLPIPGTLGIIRAHVAEPKSFLDELNRAELWNVVDGARPALQPLKQRADRAVYAGTLPIPAMVLSATPPPPPHHHHEQPEHQEPHTGLAVVIKVFRLRSPRDTLHRLARRTRATREWLGLWKLRDAGIASAMPYLLLRAKARDGGSLELLIMQRVEGRDLLHAWAEGTLGTPGGHATLTAVGQQTGDLMRATTPLFNRDHKPSNIIIDPLGIPTMIDAAGVRPWRFHRPVAMLAKLWIETLGAHALHPHLTLPTRTQRWRVVRGYCQNALGGWVLATPASRRTQTKAAWRAATLLVQRHGDPTPADDPLA